MKLRNAILVFTFILFAITGLIVYFTLGQEKFTNPAFLLSFILSIPVNMLVLFGFSIWGFSKSGTSYMRLPVAVQISTGFTATILVVGLILMYAGVANVIWPIIIFGIIGLLYAGVSTFSLIGVGYMESTDKHIKEKRLFIKMLEADAIDCMNKATSPEVRTALEVFAENVRFSDPMSHSSLSSVENSLSSLVAEISADLSVDPGKDVLEKVKRAESLLVSRNNRCLMLK